MIGVNSSAEIIPNGIWIGIGTIFLVTAVWLGVEWTYRGSEVALEAFRWGLVLGLINVPVLYMIYRIGFQGTRSRLMLGLVGSFFWKALILFGGIYWAVFWRNYPYNFFALPLFFVLFLLGFIAIYFAYQHSELPSTDGDQNG